MSDEQRMPPPPQSRRERAAQTRADAAARDASAAPAPAAAASVTPAPGVTNHIGVEKPPDDGGLSAEMVSHAKPAPPQPVFEAPSPDVEVAGEAAPLPGMHRGGFTRPPTAPVPLTVESAPIAPELEDPSMWPTPEAPPLRRGLAGWALAIAIVGLLVSLFVGWGFPIGLVAVVSAILALRRPLESRAVAVWAIALGVLSVVYSAGWLLYAAGRANLFG